MSYTPGLAPTLQEARFRQKRIGTAMGQLYAGLTGEDPPGELLDLPAQADLMQQGRSRPGRMALR